VLRLGAFAVGARTRDLDRALAEQERQAPTFPGVGAVWRNDAMPGFRRDRRPIDVGRNDDWLRAVDAVRTWVMHRGAGVRVHPPARAIEPGATVVLAIGTVVHAIAACRVTTVVDEPRRAGFAYATLPLHPECGEEGFLVERDDDGTVRFRIDVVWKPHDPLVKLGVPIARRVQRAVTAKYLDAVRRHVASGTTGPHG
jgi:uncharacterized protein (UPF0548 family)